MKMKRNIFLLTVIFCLMLTQLAWAGYTVKSGDCLSKIGKQSGVAWREIARVNNLNAPYRIYPGQTLEIPGGEIVAGSSDSAEIKKLNAEIAELERKIQALEAEQAQALKDAQAQQEIPAEPASTQLQEQACIGNDCKQDVSAIAMAPKTEKTVVAVKAEEKALSVAANDQFSAYMTGGGWKSFDTAKESEGQFLSGKIGYRPFIFNVSGHEVGVGGFLLGEIGSGTSMKKYDFDWWKVGGGVSSKIYGSYWDNSTDVGVTWQKDSSGSNEQNTYSAYLSNSLNLEQRRGAGKKFLPQTEIGLSATIPFSASKENTKNGKSMTADNKLVLGLEVKQSIYDFSLSKNHKLVPGLMAGVGLEADNIFGKFGPFIKWRAHNQDILMLELFGKKVSSVDGFRGYALLFLNFDGARKAVKSALITQPTADDLVAKK